MIRENAYHSSIYNTLTVPVFAPANYISTNKGRDDYSKHIVFGKKADHFEYFLPFAEPVIDELFSTHKVDLVVVVPRSPIGRVLSPTMSHFANWISDKFAVTHRDVISRIKAGTKQADIHDIESRFAAVQGVFQLDALEASEKNILLLDDVKTSGATVLECAHILRNAGANEVTAFCLGING